MRFNELDSLFTEEEIKNGIKKLKNKKAAGIPTEYEMKC